MTLFSEKSIDVNYVIEKNASLLKMGLFAIENSLQVLNKSINNLINTLNE